jgi:hypothetical protein
MIKPKHNIGYLTPVIETGLIKPKLVSSYTTPVANTIKLVTFSNDIQPVGSFAYKIFYPGDIDIREQITECCNTNEAVKKLATDIKTLAKQILSVPGYYLAEFKAGLDKRYPNDRELYILRWSEEDIFKGYKILPGNLKYTLEDALKDHTIVKLDIWAPLNGRYVEVSNFMIVLVEHSDGSVTYLNGEQPDYIKSIRNDVHTYFDPDNLNAFKATKRMMLLGKAYNDARMLSRILPLINSSAGLLYQVISDMNTLSDMIHKLGNRAPYEFIYREIDNFKERLSYISDFNFSEMHVDIVINDILKTKPIGDKLVMILDHLIEILLEVLNNVTIQYDEVHGIYPPPVNYTY